MNKNSLKDLKTDLSLRAKNGIDFIISAALIWFAIAYIWTLPFSAYDKSILTFIVGSLMLPFAFLLSKFLDTEWKMDDNPLQPLGLWLNFAQLFYFPFLVFILIKNPTYFVMVYVIITGAHFFPYAWFYNEKAFAIMAGLISVTSMFFGLYLSSENMFIIPVFMGVALSILAIWIFISYQKKMKAKQSLTKNLNKN
mgnify:CR=1 FL=1